MLALVAYVAVVANLAEFGENMRFRLSVEPILWLLTAFSCSFVFRMARGRIRLSRSQ
jgi:hypothetical protein